MALKIMRPAGTKIEKFAPEVKGESRIIRSNLNIENPLTLDKDLGKWSNKATMKADLVDLGIVTEQQFDSAELSQDQVVSWIKEAGYDGIFYENEVEGRGTTYVALEPEQIITAGTDIKFSRQADEELPAMLRKQSGDGRTDAELDAASSKARQKDFMQELWDTSHPSFGRDRVIMNGVRNNGDDFALVDVQIFGENEIHINSIMASETGRGNGSFALNRLIELADKHGLSMSLYADKFGTVKGAMSTAKLKKWYALHGFKPASKGNPNMTRPVNGGFDVNDPGIKFSRQVNDRAGRCYECSADELVDGNLFSDRLKGWSLVHGIPMGQGAIDGLRYGHAWLEKGNQVTDVVADVTMDKDAYYAMGHIEKTVKYTYDEAKKKMVETGHYGPWDEDINNSIHSDIKMSRQASVPAELKEWNKGSVITKTLYHGGGQEIRAMEEDRILWASERDELANTYSLRAPNPQVTPVYMTIKNPVKFIHAVQDRNIVDLMEEALAQAGKDIDERAADSLEEELKAAYGRRSYPMYEFWLNDERVKYFFQALGFDGIAVHDNKDLKDMTYGAFDTGQVASAISPNIMFSRQVQESTPEFKKFINGSKVTDVVYHGTQSLEAISEFSPEGGFGAYNHFGTWFTSEPDFAASYALLPFDAGFGPTYPVYLSIKKPFETTWENMLSKFESVAGKLYLDESAPKIKAWLKSKGYDGVMIKDFYGDGVKAHGTWGKGQDVYVALDSGQIKSAVGNQGTFDASSKNIMLARAKEPVENNLGMPEETYTEQWKRFLHDNFNRVKRLQGFIEESGGTVSHESDVYGTEGRSWSRWTVTISVSLSSMLSYSPGTRPSVTITLPVSMRICRMAAQA